MKRSATQSRNNNATLFKSSNVKQSKTQSMSNSVKCQDKNAQMFQGSSVRMSPARFPARSVAMFQGKNARTFLVNNVNRSQESSATMFPANNARMFQGSSARMSPSNSAAMFLVKHARQCPGRSVKLDKPSMEVKLISHFHLLQLLDGVLSRLVFRKSNLKFLSASFLLHLLFSCFNCLYLRAKGFFIYYCICVAQQSKKINQIFCT